MKRMALLAGTLCLTIALRAQNNRPNWQNLDLHDDGVFGISTAKAYHLLLRNLPHREVIVAVLDGGVDIRHEDLKGMIWTNPKEIPANGIDDDHNGFTDDVHGWNFTGTMAKGDPEFDLMSLAKSKKKAELQAALQPEKDQLKRLRTDLAALERILQRLGKTAPSDRELRNFIPQDAAEGKIQADLVSGLKLTPNYISAIQVQMGRDISVLETALAYEETGNYDILTGGPTAHHGTHIAGIIAAVRNNGIGIDGIADAAKIMVIRTTAGYKQLDDAPGRMMLMSAEGPARREQLAVVARSIRYAADNGAKVINMSFGNTAEWRSAELDSAVAYAALKDVLIVHAAGNLGADLDKTGDYPRRETVAGNALSLNWIEVGSSGSNDSADLADTFSNYGKKNVDVFAPGEHITSTVPLNGYWTDSGTSMAAPVVAGLAALIREYYPRLTARQVKEIIMRSVVRRDQLKDKCISGGVVNAYEAIKLAGTF